MTLPPHPRRSSPASETRSRRALRAYANARMMNPNRQNLSKTKKEMNRKSTRMTNQNKHSLENKIKRMSTQNKPTLKRREPKQTNDVSDLAQPGPSPPSAVAPRLPRPPPPSLASAPPICRLRAAQPPAAGCGFPSPPIDPILTTPHPPPSDLPPFRPPLSPYPRPKNSDASRSCAALCSSATPSWRGRVRRRRRQRWRRRACSRLATPRDALRPTRSSRSKRRGGRLNKRSARCSSRSPPTDRGERAWEVSPSTRRHHLIRSAPYGASRTSCALQETRPPRRPPTPCSRLNECVASQVPYAPPLTPAS